MGEPRARGTGPTNPHAARNTLSRGLTMGLVARGERSSRIAFCLLCLGLWLGTNGSLRAFQVCPPGAPQGQWAGPFELWPIDGWQGQQWCTSEIAHLAVLPPSIIPGSPPSTFHETRVMIVCVNGGQITTQTLDCDDWADDSDCDQHCASLPSLLWGRTYKWTPGAVSRVSEIAIPVGYPQDGSDDFFCGGHALLRDGSLLYSNGTDSLTGCSAGSPYGSVGAWRLDTSVDPPEWSDATTPTSSPSPRWYPTVLALGDGDAMVFGHFGFPMPTPLIEQTRDRFTLAPGTPNGPWLSGIPNRVQTTPCENPPLLNTYDYPRLHLLGSGEILWSSTVNHVGGSWLPRPARFLDVTPPFPCGEERWKAGLAGSTNQVPHLAGNSVHLITWDRATGQYKELVYVIGGASVNLEDVGDCANPDLAAVHGVVERMVLDPLALTSPSDTGVWQTVAPLNLPRANHNTVVLLDGSIVVIGGVGTDGTGCAWRRRVERLMPPEVIESTAPATWQCLAEQAVARQYHSSAVLLPDGRVVSAGGRNLPETETDWCKPDHTLELFTPPYAFRGAIPVIDRASLLDPAAAFYQYTGDYFVTVSFESTATLDRVALVRPGAATHAFDSVQRYVELPVIQYPTGGGTQQIQFRMPPNEQFAPPGYYLLVAVDDQGRPSAGEWIRLDV